MSPPNNGVALYKIQNIRTTTYATLLDSTPRQYVTQEDLKEEWYAQQTWVVSYDAETSIATIKSAAANGNYATVNDLLGFVVGDTNAQEFKLLKMPYSDDHFAIQEKDTDKVWYPDYTNGVDAIRAKRVPDPTAEEVSWWAFKLMPGAVSEGEGTSPL